MTQKYIADPYKFAIALATVAACLLIFGSLLYQARWEAWVFFAVALPFAYIARLYGALITISPEGISRKYIGSKAEQYAWSEIAELGVIGTKILNAGDKKKTGAMYIYFSPHLLNEEKRFNLALKWPPRDMVYLLYTAFRMDAIRPLWEKDVRLTNTGELKRV